jgi:HAD superfamily hydrolase (TIGR01490 family)
MKSAAFFDLDKTILGLNSALAFTKSFYDEGLIDRSDVARSAYRQFVFSLGSADAAQTEKMRQYLSGLVAGWEVEQLEAIVAQSINAKVTPSVHAEALELIEQHKQSGRDVVIISASGDEIVQPISRLLDADYAIGTQLEISEGRYTGEIKFYAYGEAKAVAMREAAQEHGYDLSQSYAYSDSITDLPMLEAVGRPHVVNPDSELKQIAIERGWPILSFERPAALKRPIIDDPVQRKQAAVALGVFAIFIGWWLKKRSNKRTIA